MIIKQIDSKIIDKEFQKKIKDMKKRIKFIKELEKRRNAIRNLR